jgi:hypothetical protein
MPLVPADSPLRRLPTSLGRRDVLFLDGIRYSFEIFELASNRLATTLHTLGNHGEGAKGLGPLIVEATSDAWVMIDAIHRLRELLKQTPRLKKNEPELQLFLRRTQAIEDLRHFFQHFRSEIDSFSERGTPLWGTVSWVMADRDSGLPTNHLILPGTFFQGVCGMGCTFDSQEGRFVQRVVLHAGTKAVELADLNDNVERFAKWYVGWFEATYTGDDHHGADLHLRLSISPIEQTNARIERDDFA